MDRMTKLLLALIGLGLWANAVLPVLAQDWSNMESDLSSMKRASSADSSLTSIKATSTH